MKIAFGYKMGVGKDTACDYLISKYGGTKISFSEPLYDILHYAQNVCGFPQSKDRKFLQWIGTDWGREIDDKVWIRTTLSKGNCDNNVFLSDIRFSNELAEAKARGWYCVCLRRYPTPSDRVGSGSSNHSSEVDLDRVGVDEWDKIIYNDSTLEELYKKLDELIVVINKECSSQH